MKIALLQETTCKILCSIIFHKKTGLEFCRHILQYSTKDHNKISNDREQCCCKNSEICRSFNGISDENP